MAFSLTGGLILRAFKPILVNPCFVIESTTSLQVRHAKRKGYREKVRLAKKKAKLTAERPPPKQEEKFRKKLGLVEKTEDREGKPDVPDDDVFIESHFKYKKYSIAEAVKFHQEYHHPTVCNNPDASVNVRIEVNMGKKKKGRANMIIGVTSIPYPFVSESLQDIMVLCDTNLADLALQNGAAIAGGEKLVDKIKEGSIQPALYDYILCHINFLPKLLPIRGLLKEKLPKLKDGTIISDIKTSMEKFLYGIKYSCIRLESPPDFGVMDCQIGAITQDPVQIEENFKVLLSDLYANYDIKDTELIHWVWCLSPPSKERFAIDVSKYIKKPEVVEKADDDDDDDEDDLKAKEKQKLKQMEEEYLKKEMSE